MHPLILCYHALSSDWPSSLAMPESSFRRQLRRLAASGYTGLTLSQAEERRRAGTLPGRTVVVTFDDAYTSTLLAKPVLDEFGFPATVFVVTEFAPGGRRLSWPGIEHWLDGPHAHELEALQWDGLASLAAEGWEIGSHTVTHPSLPSLDDAELERELVESRQAIVARLGRCEAIAYPYGHADDRVARAAAAAGYGVGVTLTSSHERDEPLLRPRTGLYPSDRWRERLKLSPAFGAIRRSALGGKLVRVLARD
jgi:peptidoglycan/xylan/chitin deacetylase (PgdA/CDA1 family)